MQKPNAMALQPAQVILSDKRTHAEVAERKIALEFFNHDWIFWRTQSCSPYYLKFLDAKSPHDFLQLLKCSKLQLVRGLSRPSVGQPLRVPNGE